MSKAEREERLVSRGDVNQYTGIAKTGPGKTS